MLDLVITGRYFHSFGWNELETKVASIGVLDGCIVHIGSEVPKSKEHIILNDYQFLVPGQYFNRIH